MDKGTRIRALRETAGMSQVELAERVGISKQTLYKYENGIVTNIPSDKIEAIAAALDSRPEYIMGWEGSPEKRPGYTEKFCRLSPANQRTIEIMIDAFLQQEEKK